jgi:hypothetical protein
MLSFRIRNGTSRLFAKETLKYILCYFFHHEGTCSYHELIRQVKIFNICLSDSALFDTEAHGNIVMIGRW